MKQNNIAGLKENNVCEKKRSGCNEESLQQRAGGTGDYRAVGESRLNRSLSALQCALSWSTVMSSVGDRLKHGPKTRHLDTQKIH